MLASSGKGKTAEIIDSKTGNINSISINYCVWSSYDHHPEKKGLITNSVWVPLKVGLAPITMFTKNGLGMEYSSGNFIHDEIKPQKNRTVILKNLTFGSDSNNVAKVFSIRKYDSKKGSDKINFTRGQTHSNKYFIVRNGMNKINYEIINDKTNFVIKDGVIELFVTSPRGKCMIDSSLDFIEYLQSS